MNSAEQLETARAHFIEQWGVIGNRWGINRTMAQIHALLLSASEPMSTDQVMAALEISRGNAHTNLRELTQWGLIRSVLKKGDRKEYFEAEKDVAKMFSIVVRERKSREFDPALAALKECRDQTERLKTKEGEAFHQQITDLCDFFGPAGALLSQFSAGMNSKIFTSLLKHIK